MPFSHVGEFFTRQRDPLTRGSRFHFCAATNRGGKFGAHFVHTMANRKAAGDLFTSFWARTALRNIQQATKKKKTNGSTTNRWKIVTGDFVEVISGHNVGERGKVISVIRDQNRIVVENVNVRPRHVTRRDEGGDMPKKEVMLKPCSLAYSNVMLIDPSTDKPTKVARRFLEDGTKVQLEL